MALDPSRFIASAPALIARCRAMFAGCADRDLVSAYLFGSALYGPFTPGRSDIDVWVVLPNAKPRMAALAWARNILRAHRAAFDSPLEFTCIFEDQTRCKVAARPYINNMAGDHGALLFGQPSMPQDEKLDPADLLGAIRFDIREFSRFFCDGGVAEHEFRLVKNIRAHLRGMTQLLESHDLIDAYYYVADDALSQLAARYAPIQAAEAALRRAIGGSATHDDLMTALLSLEETSQLLVRTIPA